MRNIRYVQHLSTGSHERSIRAHAPCTSEEARIQGEPQKRSNVVAVETLIVRMIENVESIGPQLQAHALISGHLELLFQRDIQLVKRIGYTLVSFHIAVQELEVHQFSRKGISRTQGTRVRRRQER